MKKLEIYYSLFVYLSALEFLLVARKRLKLVELAMELFTKIM